MATRLGTAVRIHLKPKSRHQLSDTRSILDALKKFGEVNTFKNLKFDFYHAKSNDINRCIRVIFDEKEAAERAIAASPLKVSISQRQPQSQSQLANNPSSTESPSSNPYTDSVLTKHASIPDIAPTNQVITCTIEPDTHTEAMITFRTKFNVHNTRKKDNLILHDLTGPETNIPLPQLADTIRREGMEFYDKKRKPNPNAPTLMDLYREGVQAAADAKNPRSKIVTLDEAQKSHQRQHQQQEQQHETTARESGLKRLAKEKTHHPRMAED
ncbi:unnamed protein product [Penicillium pancosmium]